MFTIKRQVKCAVKDQTRKMIRVRGSVGLCNSGAVAHAVHHKFIIANCLAKRFNIFRNLVGAEECKLGRVNTDFGNAFFRVYACIVNGFLLFCRGVVTFLASLVIRIQVIHEIGCVFLGARQRI